MVELQKCLSSTTITRMHENDQQMQHVCANCKICYLIHSGSRYDTFYD